MSEDAELSLLGGSPKELKQSVPLSRVQCITATQGSVRGSTQATWHLHPAKDDAASETSDVFAATTTSMQPRTLRQGKEAGGRVGAGSPEGGAPEKTEKARFRLQCPAQVEKTSACW